MINKPFALFFYQTIDGVDIFFKNGDLSKRVQEMTQPLFKNFLNYIVFDYKNQSWGENKPGLKTSNNYHDETTNKNMEIVTLFSEKFNQLLILDLKLEPVPEVFSFEEAPNSSIPTTASTSSSSSSVISSQIPNFYSFREVTFYFSNELIENLQGHRGEDHQIKMEVLENALKKKINIVRKKPQSEYSFYFKVIKNNSSRILNVFVKPLFSQEGGDRNSFTVFTAYYMPSHSIKWRFGNPSSERYKVWENSISQINLDQVK